MKINISYIVAAILVIGAGICKALVDTIAFHKGGVFKGNNFYNINIQGKFLHFTKYPLDAFHLGNSLMIFLFVGAVVIAARQKLWISVIAFVVLGILFNLSFNLFWNHIFN